MLEQTLDSTQAEVGGGNVQSCAMIKVTAGGVEHCVERRDTDTLLLVENIIRCQILSSHFIICFCVILDIF